MMLVLMTKMDTMRVMRVKAIIITTKEGLIHGQRRRSNDPGHGHGEADRWKGRY